MKYYSHTLIELARRFRKHPTETEKLLWKKLKNYQLNGLKFKRQHRIGRYITDFYCAELRLIIELEGGIHDMSDQREYDRDRIEALSARRLRVLRVKNEEVLNEIETVLGEILKFKESG